MSASSPRSARGVGEIKGLLHEGGGGQPAREGIADLVRWQLDYDLSFSPEPGGPLPVVAAFS